MYVFFLIFKLKNTLQYLKRSEDSSKASLIQVNGYTPAGDIARWLEYKGFSYRVLEIIGGLDGEALFSLNRNQLIGVIIRKWDTLQRGISGLWIGRGQTPLQPDLGPKEEE